MPQMDGWTFCRIRQRLELLKAIPVVAISAHPSFNRCAPSGVEAILPKPFHPDDITRVIMRIMGSAVAPSG
jgi:CheY-like chemotaxis protein